MYKVTCSLKNLLYRTLFSPYATVIGMRSNCMMGRANPDDNNEESSKSKYRSGLA